MKKLTILLFSALCAVWGFNVRAQALGQASVIEPQGKYVTYLNELIITWGEDVELIDPQQDAYGDYCIPASITGFGEESTVFFSYVQEWDNASWTYKVLKNQLSARVLDFCQDPETWTFKNGEVSVALPEGVVKNDSGQTNAAQTFEFVLMNAIYDAYTVVPAENSFVNPASFEEVVLTFEGTVELFDTTTPITVLYGESTIELPAENIYCESNELTIKMGKYGVGDVYVAIPTNYVVVTDSNGKKSINNEIYLYYKLWEGLPSAEIVYPIGKTLTSIEKPVEVTWNCDVTLKEGVLPTVNVYNSDIYDETVEASFLKLNGNVLSIDLSSFAERIPSGTIIEITLPEGLVEGEEGINPGEKLQINYYRVYGNETQFDLDDSVISIHWDGVQYLDTNFIQSLYILNPDGSKKDLTWSYNDMPGEVKIARTGPYAYVGLEVTLSLLELEQGDYSLVLPEGILYIYGADYSAYVNPGGKFKFTWDGETLTSVKNIVDSSSDGLFRVYNLQGVNILNTTDENALKTLSNGIYIVNGKKVVIRN